MKIKSMVGVVIVGILLLSLCACGDKKGNQTETKDGKKVWYLGGNNLMASDVELEDLFAETKDTIDPEKIYGSLTYTEDLIHGSYAINNLEKDLKKIRKEYSYKNVAWTEESYDMIPLPVAVHLGKGNLSTGTAGYKYLDFANVTEFDVAVLEFATKDQLGHSAFKYEVSGNKIRFTELNQTNNSDEEFACEMGKAVFEYTFSIQGPYFTLSNGEESIQLTAYSFTDNVSADLTFTGYSVPKSPLVEELDYFYSSIAVDYAVKNVGDHYYRSAYKISDDGRITVYLSEKDEEGEQVAVHQYAYILKCEGSNYFNSFGIVLLDGEKQYHYTDSITDREARILAQEGTANAFAEEKLKEVAEKKQDLYDDLQEEFKEKGIAITINRQSGEMAMDASVLFGGDSAEVTEQGKSLINQFMEVYSSVIYNEKYDGFISKTRVEGHIAPISGSTYESGLPLSTQRAENVKQYCISSGQGDAVAKLAASLEAVGLSNQNPVYDVNGEVDLAACRRVSFRFIVDTSE